MVPFNILNKIDMKVASVFWYYTEAIFNAGIMLQWK